MGKTPEALSVEIGEYHAHVYYGQESRDRAAWLREEVAKRFTVKVGNWHDELVGPHLASMYQLAFSAEHFATLVPWLMLNRQGLSILVHPESGLGHAGDHTTRALWLGEQLPVRLEFLRKIDVELGLS